MATLVTWTHIPLLSREVVGRVAVHSKKMLPSRMDVEGKKNVVADGIGSKKEGLGGGQDLCQWEV